MSEQQRTIVISAVNIRKGGTLTILRQCLEYLSQYAVNEKCRIVALVCSKDLAYFPNIEYIEIPWSVKSWILRIWCEYVTMYRISRSLSPIYLWLSLHDTTPNVLAERQAVYCQTSFPFMRCRLQDWKFDYKIAIFSMLTKFVYRINIKKNIYLVVQANWLRNKFSNMFGIKPSKFIVSPPKSPIRIVLKNKDKNRSIVQFLFASTPDCHKNFEVLCNAAHLLEQEIGPNRFKVVLTISGDENKYARWLYRKWGSIMSIKFIGFQNKEKLYKYYEQSDCLVFPSRVETWGLPISEFAQFDKPMLLADLPYAYETAAGSKYVAFFNPESPEDLKTKMRMIVEGDTSMLKMVNCIEINDPKAMSWSELFNILLT